MHAYFQYLEVYYSQVGGGEEFSRASPYLYYDLTSLRIVNLGTRQAKFPVIYHYRCSIRNCFRTADFIAMKQLRRFPE